MRLGVVSDLHLEFRENKELSAWQILADKINNLDVDLVVNAGDIHPSPAMRFKFAQAIRHPYQEVLGNHDFYHQQTIQDSKFCFSIKGVKIAGATLWTDFKQRHPHVMMGYNDHFTDGFQIKKAASSSTLADEVYQRHLNDVEFLRFQKPDIVVTHHGPSMQVVHPMFRNGGDSNHFFCSNLDMFIRDNDNIKVWIFGHTHGDMDVFVGGTRIVSRQLGYPNENYKHTNQYQPLVIEI
jgi:predicted phosphodiesterase